MDEHSSLSFYARVSDPAPHAFPFTTLLAVPHDMHAYHFRELARNTHVTTHHFRCASLSKWCDLGRLSIGFSGDTRSKLYMMLLQSTILGWWNLNIERFSRLAGGLISSSIYSMFHGVEKQHLLIYVKTCIAFLIVLLNSSGIILGFSVTFIRGRLNTVYSNPFSVCDPMDSRALLGLCSASRTNWTVLVDQHRRLFCFILCLLNATLLCSQEEFPTMHASRNDIPQVERKQSHP